MPSRMALFFGFLDFRGYHLYQLVDIIGSDYTFFLEDEFDTLAEFFSGCGCQQSGDSGAYGCAEYEGHESFHSCMYLEAEQRI